MVLFFYLLIFCATYRLQKNSNVYRIILLAIILYYLNSSWHRPFKLKALTKKYRPAGIYWFSSHDNVGIFIFWCMHTTPQSNSPCTVPLKKLGRPLNVYVCPSQPITSLHSSNRLIRSPTGRISADRSHFSDRNTVLRTMRAHAPYCSHACPYYCPTCPVPCAQVSNPPGPLINRLKWFCGKIRFRRDLQFF